MSAKASLLKNLRSRSGIERLFFFGWRGSLALIILLFIALVFAFGFWWAYWRVADMDTWMVYEAFLQNDGLAQTYFAHPGYLTILALGSWFKLAHAMGVLPVHALAELPPENDMAASAAAWMRATQAARGLSLILALIFLGSFAIFIRRWLKEWRVAALATFALAYSGGFMMEARIVRTELIAAGFAFIALLVLLDGMRRSPAGRTLALGVAGLFAMLAMLNKVQVIFPLLTFPPILYVFADSNRHGGETRGSWQLLVIALVAAISLAIMAAPIAAAGLVDAGAVARRVALFRTVFPIYQTAIAAWILGWMIACARKCRTGALEFFSGLACMVAGAALGLLALRFRFDVGNAVAVMNPFETMLEFAILSDSGLAQGGALGVPMLHALGDGLLLLAARFTFVLSSSPRPTVFLAWAVIAMMLFAWRRGERRAVLQAALLIAASLAVDWAGTLRGLKAEYFILSDPLVILAAALLLVRVRALQTHRFAYPVGAALVVATVAVGLAEPVKHTFKTEIPDELCAPHFPRTERIGHFSFCPP